MKKLIIATAAAAFVLATGFANAEDTKQNAGSTQKTPTEQQMKTNATGGAKMNAQTPAGTTGAAASTNMQSGASTTPGKPTDKAKDLPK